MKEPAIVPDFSTELTEILRLERGSSGVLMKLMNGAGRMTGGAVAVVGGISAQALQSALEGLFGRLLDVASGADAVGIVRNAPPVVNRVGVSVSGAVGGFFGLPGVVPDVLASTVVIFNAIQKVARKHGFDPNEERVRQECIAVFAAGGPSKNDDASGESYLASKLILTGPAVHGLVQKVSARFAAHVMTKFGTQAVPVLGAVTGATINYAFLQYYERMAEVHFRLMRLQADYPERDVLAAYRDTKTTLKGKSKARLR